MPALGGHFSSEGRDHNHTFAQNGKGYGHRAITKLNRIVSQLQRKKGNRAVRIKNQPATCTKKREKDAYSGGEGLFKGENKVRLPPEKEVTAARDQGKDKPSSLKEDKPLFLYKKK